MTEKKDTASAGERGVGNSSTLGASSTLARVSAPGIDEAAAVWVERSALKPWDRNPRQNAAAVAHVAASIKRFGFGAPIIARRADGEVIAGHTRLLAAESLGLERVPVRFLDLDPADAHLLALADNKLGEIAEWDMQALLDELERHSLPDVALAGWDEKELEKLGDVSLTSEELAEDDSSKIDNSLVIVVTCDNEDQQVELLEKFVQMGLTCRAVM